MRVQASYLGLAVRGWDCMTFGTGKDIRAACQFDIRELQIWMCFFRAASSMGLGERKDVAQTTCMKRVN
jgi:hypothetical protein